MSRRLFRAAAAVAVLSAAGCAVLGDALDKSFGRALGETEADYQKRRTDRDRAESFERGGMSQSDAAEMAARMRATDAMLESGNAFKWWK